MQFRLRLVLVTLASLVLITSGCKKKEEAALTEPDPGGGGQLESLLPTYPLKPGLAHAWQDLIP